MLNGFKFDEFLLKYRYPFLILFSGLILALFGVFYFRSGLSLPQTKVEVLNATTGNQNGGEITVEIAGAVVSPGVYKVSDGARIDDLLIKAGGFSVNADRVWTDKYLNRAAILTDGQKLYIPSAGEQSGSASAKNNGGDQTVSPNLSSDSNSMLNINTASLSELDSLPGIGQVYGQSIIEHRPYSMTSELVSKGAIKQSLYDKIKDRVTIY